MQHLYAGVETMVVTAGLECWLGVSQLKVNWKKDRLITDLKFKELDLSCLAFALGSSGN